MLVVGDSLMRQLHARLVAMFRGAAPPIMDVHVSGLLRYALCRAGDSLAIADGCDSRPFQQPTPGQTLNS